MSVRHLLLLAALLLMLAACMDTNNPVQQPVSKTSQPDSMTSPNPVDRELRQLIADYKLTGNPASNRQLPNINSPLAQLGKQLFFSRALSGDLDVACVSCHHPLLGGGDNLSLSIGTNSENPEVIGHNRHIRTHDTPTTPRNAPTTFNIGLWDSVMFHDGRVESLEKSPGRNGNGPITTPDSGYPKPDPLAGINLVQAQARFPLTSATEMRGKNFEADGTTQSCRVAIAERLGGYGAHAADLRPDETTFWLEAFRKAFNAPDGLPHVLINEQNISLALSEYERSQVFVNNAWKNYIEGENSAISERAKQGALLFYRPKKAGGAGCAACHRGDFFTDENFHHTLIPPIGLGKSNEIPAEDDINDYGRWLVTQEALDKFRFRTPSLLNVEVTGPWGHNGAYTSLANIVRHMLNPYQSALHYDAGQVQQSSVRGKYGKDRLREMLGCDVAIAGQDYKEEQVQSLVAFLLTLTDPCTKDRTCLAPWIIDPPTDGYDPMRLLKARKNNGKRL